jgi:hypothetical protein
MYSTEFMENQSAGPITANSIIRAADNTNSTLLHRGIFFWGLFDMSSPVLPPSLRDTDSVLGISAAYDG